MIDTYLNNYRRESTDNYTWMVKNEDAIRTPGIDERCNVEYIQAFLDKTLKNVRVTKAEINNTGHYDAPMWLWMMPDGEDTISVDNLPEYCHVEVEREMNAGYEKILVWVPTVWCGRYISENGAALRTNYMWEFSDPMAEPVDLGSIQAISPVLAIRNGFACSNSDGAIRNPSIESWPLDPETGIVDKEKIRNYVWTAGHYNAVIGKLVTEALTGEKPAYSYAQGCSGGGRNCMQMARNTPQDFDALFAWAPPISWVKCLAEFFWVNSVMHDLGDYLPYEKLDVFRDAVIAKYGGLKKYQQLKGRPTFDARECIGAQSERGEITELDAKVMNLIWRGPVDENGTLLAPGWRPGVKFYGGLGFAYVDAREEELVPVRYSVLDTFATWAYGDFNWDWNTVTMENFGEFYRDSYARFAEMGASQDDANYLELANCGTKLIMAVGTDDDCVNPQVILDFYNEINRIVSKGDMEKTREFCRFFYLPGMVHSRLDYLGAGPTIVSMVNAMMDWAEDGLAPDTLHCIHADADSGEFDYEADIACY
ncbi:MAG: tannase/feruloyl esterase family alpha/beta hydrolase [Coriobacteriaceae bacterium]|nr:tannase/feruloyl esterase family alpha/beta hydrolase [Coriobacteriaceae bacterium]